MKTTPIFLFSILLLGACGGPAARAKRPGAKAQAAAAVQAEPKTYTYRIAATYPHSTDAYTVHNLLAGYRWTFAGGKALTPQLRVDNVTDAYYESTQYYPMPLRNYLVSLLFEF